MQEFSKMQTIDVFQLKNDFEKFERRTTVRKQNCQKLLQKRQKFANFEILFQKPRSRSAVPQLPVVEGAKLDEKNEAPVVQKREKKMRKKRKMIRQKVEGESSTSSSESDFVQQDHG